MGYHAGATRCFPQGAWGQDLRGPSVTYRYGALWLLFLGPRPQVAHSLRSESPGLRTADREAPGADLKQQDSVVSVVSVVRDCEQLPAKTTEATKNNRVQRRKRPKQPENNRPNGENNRNNSPAVFSRSPRLFLLLYGPRCFRLAPGACYLSPCTGWL